MTSSITSWSKMKQTAVFLILTVIIEFSWCKCKHSYMTICDNFEDIQNNDDVYKWTEIVIGGNSESGNLSALNFDDINALLAFKLRKLRTLMINGRINQLNSQDIQPRCGLNLSELQSLTFFGNDLKRIEKYHNIPNILLSKLSLANNRIEGIAKDAFVSHKIEYLDISDNFLEDIEKGALPLTNVTKTVKITNNRLKRIAPGSLPYHLRVLNVDYNNLSHIERGVFVNLYHLEELTLSHNKFKTIPSVNQLVELKFFDISFNLISSVHNSHIGPIELQFLDLSHNRITNSKILNKFLPSSTTTNSASNVHSLSLAFNYLKELEITEDISSFQLKLFLYGNPWDCVKWDSMAKQILALDKHCATKYYSSGKIPYCFGWSSAVEENGEGIERFHRSSMESMNFMGCNPATEKYFYKFRIDLNCDNSVL